MAKTAFKIPLQSEIEAHIKTKKQWPEKFIKYYAEKFWNHYQASGWKLSNGNAVKDWKAAFNSQWQTPKYKDDIEFLNKCAAEKKVIMNKIEGSELTKVDDLLMKYKQHPTDVPFSEFGKWYDLLKSERLLRPFTQAEVDHLRAVYDNDNTKCRCACVQMTFDGYCQTDLLFSNILEARRRLNG